MRILAFIFIACFYLPVFGQNLIEFQKNSEIKLAYHYGFLLPEYSFIRQQSEEGIHGFELSWVKKSDGSSYWHPLYNYPSAGIGIYHSGLGNDRIYGQQTALFFQTGSNFFSTQRQKFAIPWLLGVGVCRVTKKYDPLINPYNVAVGSNFNIYFRASLSWNFTIGKKIVITQGLTFHHLSNANLSEPNIGLNWLSLHHSFAFLPTGNPIKQKLDFPACDRRIQHQVFLSYGIKHTRSFESYKYSTASLSYSALWIPSYIVSFGLGADLFYDSSVKDELETEQREFKDSYLFHSGVHFEQKMVYNKMSFGIQEGIYLGLKEKVGNHTFYNRAFIQRRLGKSLSIMLSVKTHLHILDHVEIGIGWNFKKSTKNEVH